MEKLTTVNIIAGIIVLLSLALIYIALYQFGKWAKKKTQRDDYFEQKIKGASSIDQYDLVNKTYTHSFYLYHSPKNQLRNFTIYKNKIFAIVDHELYIYNKRK